MRSHCPRLPALVIAFVGLSATAVASQGAPPGLIPVSAIPLLTGGAEAPKTVLSGKRLHYVLIARDLDTYRLNEGPSAPLVQTADPQLTLQVKRITSMLPDQWTRSRRGVAADGTTTWDVTGPAITVKEAAIRGDSFLVTDQRKGNADLLKDVTIEIVQSVSIDP
ncbi:MAG: hypothetical protein FJX77_05785 [Armatimonadetes bacterium]|nr:hypothetical protein [Armatimonadota bacterium]